MMIDEDLFLEAPLVHLFHLLIKAFKISPNSLLLLSQSISWDKFFHQFLLFENDYYRSQKWAPICFWLYFLILDILRYSNIHNYLKHQLKLIDISNDSSFETISHLHFSSHCSLKIFLDWLNLINKTLLVNNKYLNWTWWS